MRNSGGTSGGRPSLGRAARRVGALVACLVVVAARSTTAEGDGLPLAERLSGIIPARMESDGVPGLVVVLLREGRPVWTAAYGMADTETGRRMTTNAVFRVESISKPVTAWGVMRLVAAGRLDLDSPVSDCLSRWQPPQDPPAITARALLSHQAGIGIGNYAERYPPGAPMPDLAEHLASDFRRTGAPGDGFAYSDTGFNLLELVIEDCAGEHYATFMTREVLRPLGMVSAGYDWSGRREPVGHDLRGRPVAPYLYPGRASGGLFATAGDVARFAAAGMEGARQQVLSRDSIARMHEPTVAVGGLFAFAADGYGLGHFTERLSDGRASVWHGGQGYGWMSHMHLVPTTGDGIVLLSNSQRSWPLFAAVLKEWSRGLGVAPVGMSRVLLAERAARMAILLLLAVALLAAYGLATLRTAPKPLRVAAVAVGGPLAAWPVWVSVQDYAFLFSILPGSWGWLAAASAAAGLALSAFGLTGGRPGRRARG